MHHLARFSTSPGMIKFACKNGIKQNPMFMKCDSCPNQSSCEIFFSNNPPTQLSQREKDLIQNDLDNARQNKNTNLTPAEQWQKIRIGMAVFAVIIFIAWLTS